MRVFQKLSLPAQNSGRQTGDGDASCIPGKPINIRHHSTKFSRWGDMEPWDSAPYKNTSMSIYITFMFHANVQAAQKSAQLLT